MTGKPKKTKRVYSKNFDAVSHRTKNQLYARLGFKQQKIFLGKDTREKLAFLVSLQHGENVDDLTVSDVLSYCINTCYNSKSVQEEVKKRSGLPKMVKAAKTPEGQRLYRYYQMAQASDAGDLVEAFNAKNKRGKPYIPHINNFIKNIDLDDLCLDGDPWEDIDGQEEEEDVAGWSPMEIQSLCNRKAISKAIKELNEKVFPPNEEET